MTTSKRESCSGDAPCPPRADLTDYADLGTAFGLDAAVGGLQGVHSPPAQAEQPTAPPWDHRLIRRTGL